jgi:hypothetical protein
MGRPPVGKTAMTGAERVRRHRARMRDELRKKADELRKKAAAKREGRKKR